MKEMKILKFGREDEEIINPAWPFDCGSNLSSFVAFYAFKFQDLYITHYVYPS